MKTSGAMAYDWKRLEKLNAGDAILFIEPMLDAKDEVWFYASGTELRLHSQGTLVKQVPLPPSAKHPVTARHTLYKLAGSLFVDVEVRGDAAVLRRGILNGRIVATMLAPAEVEAALARYRKLGFKDGTPFNVTPSKVTLREYRKKDKNRLLGWTIHVDGTSVVEDWRNEKKAGSREAALAAAEKRIAAREKEGFALHLIELTKAEYANPTPKAPKGTPAAQALPKRPVFPKPKDAYAAVDAAVARLRDLHERLPHHHFVAELIDPTSKEALARVTSLEGTFFLRMHKQRLGRWLRSKPGAPKKRESSWDYFVRVYGSITWILAGEADDDLPMFYCGNVSGGGWSCLEVAPRLYDTDELADALGDEADEAVRELEVFHGGWHTDRSFAFDTRAASSTGEHPIVPFDEGSPTVPQRPGKPVAFGHWLFGRVEKLTKLAENNLRQLA